MTRAEDDRPERQPHPGAWTFFKRYFANPLAMGSLVPSSASLRRLVSRGVECADDEVVVEFGGGTGAVTRAILDAGVPPERLWSIELDPELAGFLARLYPDVHVIHGDCRGVETLLAPGLAGRVGTVVLGIPMVLLPLETQREIIAAIFRILSPSRGFLHYTFCIGSPLDRDKLGLSGRRLGWTPLNVPPASVWRYAAAANV